MRISAVVCTHNRARLLPRTLTSLSAQTLPADAYEVVVVDNGSMDETAAVVRRFQDEAAAVQSRVCIRYCLEAELGVSAARNRGFREARAPIVAYTDDDATPEPGWLAALLTAWEAETARPLAIGGRIELELTESARRRLPTRARGMLGEVDLGDRRHVCEPPFRLFGANLSFERSFLIETGGFDVRLGRRGTQLLGNEELEMLHRVAAQGGQVVYDPAAAVHHTIGRERRTLAYQLRLNYACGVSDGLMAGIQGRRSTRGETVARQGRRLIFGLWSLARKPDSDRAFSYVMDLAHDLGETAQLLRLDPSGRNAARMKRDG